MSYKEPPFDTALAARTAEAMALPLMLCRHRDCRRGQRCRWHFKSTGEPCCLRNLDPAQRKLFDRIYREARSAKGFLGSNSEDFDTRSGPQRLSDDLSIAIARHVASRWRPEQWDAARRAREKRMAVADRQTGAED